MMGKGKSTSQYAILNKKNLGGGGGNTVVHSLKITYNLHSNYKNLLLHCKAHVIKIKSSVNVVYKQLQTVGCLVDVT